VGTRGEVGLQRRLVVLDRQEVVAAGRDDLRAEVALGQQGVRRHHPPFQRQPPERLLGRRQLLAFALGAQLRHGRRGSRIVASAANNEPGAAAGPGGSTLPISVTSSSAQPLPAYPIL